MRIVKTYSHLNGLKYLEAKKPHLLKDIRSVIETVDTNSFKTKISKEKTMLGKKLFSPTALNKAIGKEFKKKGWNEERVTYWVTQDERITKKIMNLSPKEQKEAIEFEKETALRSFNQTDFVKERVAVEVQLGKYSFVAYDLFVKHLTFYGNDVIDLGVEIIPMKELESQMSSGPPYYERELFHLLRQGRSNPAVPIILMGIAP